MCELGQGHRLRGTAARLGLGLYLGAFSMEHLLYLDVYINGGLGMSPKTESLQGSLDLVFALDFHIDLVY